MRTLLFLSSFWPLFKCPDQAMLKALKDALRLVMYDSKAFPRLGMPWSTVPYVGCGVLWGATTPPLASTGTGVSLDRARSQTVLAQKC